MGTYETTTDFYAFEVTDDCEYRFMYHYKTQNKKGKPCNTQKIAIIKEGIHEWNST